MKKLLLFLFIAVVTFATAFAQAPQKFSYQAVVRDAGNNLVATQSVGVQISILQGSATGAAVYVETQTVTTNANGLMTLEIGGGTVVSGDFATIDWANGPYFLKTETDPTGGTNYTITGTQQLLSVPFALYAATSGNGEGPQGPAGPQGEQGPAGPQGEQGPVGPQGEQGPAGPQGEQGPAGPQGEQGPAGPQGDPGAAGAAGADGLSAYQIWLNAGHTGTEADFLASLQGAQGLQGEQGPQGDPGAAGAAGADGLSAYQIWLNAGHTGTEADFLASLQGAQGVQGEQGPQGNPGATGAAGVSPVVTTNAVANGTEVTITDANGDHTFTITNGQDGVGVPQTLTLSGDQLTISGGNTITLPVGGGGLPGRGIDTITGPVHDGLIDTYTILYTDGTQSQFTVTNGANGTNGTDGINGTNGTNGQDGVSPTVTTSAVAGGTEVTITDVNGDHTFTVTNGIQGNQGAQGAPGRGIVSIARTGTDGHVDTYTITYSDATTSTFQITNGEDGTNGVDGAPGAQGAPGRGITSVSKTGNSGLVDTYTITYSDASTSTFQITNGAAGADGVSPTVTATQNGSNLIITVTDANGTHQYPISTVSGEVTQLPANWTEDDSSSPQYIMNKPNLADVAISGSYGDLTGTPTTVSTFENDAHYITMDSIPTRVSTFENDAHYITMDSIPTRVSAFDNDAHYLTSYEETQELSISNDTIYLTGGSFVVLPAIPDAQVNADWTATSGVEEILNKPTEVSAFNNDAGYLTADSIADLNAQIADMNHLLDSLQQAVEEANFTCGTSKVKDYDGNEYNTVLIGSQCWMKENLRTTHFADGTEIAIDGVSTAPSLFYPHNDAAEVETYGCLYNWSAVMNGASSSEASPSGVQGVCPAGWHVPSDAEWNKMESTVTAADMTVFNERGDHAGKLAGGSDGTWYTTATAGAPGNYSDPSHNASGFSALPAGSYGAGYDFRIYAAFWCATGTDMDMAIVRILTNSRSSVNRQFSSSQYGYSVRCVRDASEQVNELYNQIDDLQHAIEELQGQIGNDSIECPATVQDFEGHTYNTVKIGRQCWMRENLRTTHYADGTDVLSSEYRHVDDNDIYDATYGLVYSWTAAMNGASASNAVPSNVQGICPDGWHLPSKAEIQALVSYVGSQDEYRCGGNSQFVAQALASNTSDWTSVGDPCTPGENWSDNNATGLRIQPAGYYENGHGYFGMSKSAYFWSATASQVSGGCSYGLSYRDEVLNISENTNSTAVFNTIRCLRNTTLNDAMGETINELQNTIDSMQQALDNASFACGVTKVTDIDGNEYTTVKIGNQCWMKENLRTTHFPNGVEIEEGTTVSDTIPYRYAPNGDNSNVADYGYLYNWSAALNGAAASNANPSGVQGICPDGWHMPSEAEWLQMRSYVRGKDEYICDMDARNVLKAMADWNVGMDECSVAQNATGFSALPAGRRQTNNTYLYFGNQAHFWASNLNGSYTRYISIGNYSAIGLSVNNNAKSCGSSIRCVRDAMSDIDRALNDMEEEMGSQVENLQNTIDSLHQEMADNLFICETHKVRDYDGNEYATVKIGNQCWMKENLRTTHYTDGHKVDYVESCDPEYGDPYYAYPGDWEGNNVQTYGLLYSWNAAMREAAASETNPSGVQGICPTGWHLPSMAEWQQLENYINSRRDYLCGGTNDYNAKALADTGGWIGSVGSCYVGDTPEANNLSGFSARPAGEFNLYSFEPLMFGEWAVFWSTVENTSTGISFKISNDYYAATHFQRDKLHGYSVRCLRDEVSVMENVINGVQQEMDEQTQEAQQALANATFMCGTTKVSDYDGNEYATVRIGNQCWMKENLRTSHYSDGVEIPVHNSDLYYTETNRYAPGNNEANVPVYGYLYSRHATMRGDATSTDNPSGIQGACPTGWHVPSAAEWTQLTDYVGSQSRYRCGGISGNIAKALSATTGWATSGRGCAVGNTPANNNATGFSAMAAGSNNFNMGDIACFWTATENGSSDNYYQLYSDDAHPQLGYNDPLDESFSVRCVRDEMSAIDNALNDALNDVQGLINSVQGLINDLHDVIDSLQNEVTMASCGFIKVTDIDGNEYQTVRVGNQCWMRENLRTTKYPDGTNIPRINSVNDDEDNYYAYPEDDASKVATYGLLYNWAAAMNNASTSTASPSGVQGICPDGWHLPSDAEWEQLRAYVGRGSYICGGNSANIAKALASTMGWDSHTDDCTPGNTPSTNNATDFNAMPSGYYNNNTNSYIALGTAANYWSATENNANTANFLPVAYNFADVSLGSINKHRGYSVRCVKD